MGTSTPWGMSDHSKKIARGIVEYSTPGHGGLHVSPTVNAKIHSAWRKAKGWYEEDCEYFIVAFTFPELFSRITLDDSKRTLKNYYPHQYEEVTGEKVFADESYVLRQEIFKESTKDKLVVVAAMGDWNAKVPAGMVGVIAVRGGRGNYGEPKRQEKFFLLPKEDYNVPHGFGFVVDESKGYKEIDSL